MINSSIFKKISNNILNKSQIKHIKTNFTKITPNLKNVNIIYNVTNNQTISSSYLINNNNNNNNFTINSFNNYKNRFYSSNINQFNNDKSEENNKNNNNESNNFNNDNNNNNNNENNYKNKQKILNFLNRNKKNMLFSAAGIGLGFLGWINNNNSISNDNEDIEEKPYYFKILRFKITEKYLVIGSLVAANVLVWALLKNAHFFNRFGGHFFLSPSTLNTYPSSLILSTFTHTEGFHILFNMYALASFGSGAYDHLGTRDFLALYFIGGLFGSMASLTYKLLVGSYALPSIGASGSVLSLAASAIFFENSRVGFIFLPMFDFEGIYVLAALVLFDLCGLALPFVAKRSPFDHACHLGSTFSGAVIGYLYPFKEKYQNFNGNGKIVTPNYIYQGEFHNGKFNGMGQLNNSSHIYKGVFKDDQFLRGQRYNKSRNIIEQVERNPNPRN
ncbi:hypothetical protein ACTFIU_004554 [Dictyostelium citrinum]